MFVRLIFWKDSKIPIEGTLQSWDEAIEIKDYLISKDYIFC